MKKSNFTNISLKPSIVKLSSSYLLLVSISLFLLCLALGSALMTSYHANELIAKRQNLTETNNIVYSLLLDLGYEDIFLASKDEKFQEAKNLSIYQISKILNSYSKEIKIEELSSFNLLAKQFVETPFNERRKITYKLQIETKKILSKLRDQIATLTSEIENEMTEIISTMSLIISFATIFMLFSIIYNFVDRRKWDKLIAETTAAKKNAENLSNLKSQFLATVSHEVRTPLNGIIATAEVLGTNHSLDKEAKKMCSVVQSSGNTLLRIINDILDYSKIESGNIHFNFESFNIKNLIEEILLTNKHRAIKKNIDLKVIYKNIRFDIILMDRDRLAQVLYNIVGNAIKFTEKGSVTLIVEMFENKKNLFLRLTVKDTGVGISDDEKDKVFVPFIQIQSQGTSGEAGTGLGLSISKKIVDKLDGVLTFQSNLGIGTDFVVCIPIKKGDPKQITNELNKNNNNSNLIIWNRPLNENLSELDKMQKIIFIAEDNPTNQIVINTMLNFENIPHVLFSNGNELLTALKNARPRMILMDCQMPIMDGYEATRIIKLKFPYISIIAMTADATELNIEKCRLNGFDGIMIKPLNMSVIKELLLDFRLILNTKQGDRLDKIKNSDPILSAIADLDQKYGKDKRLKITNAFLQQINELDQELLEKVESSNLQGLKNLGHKLKSSSQIVGADKFVELFKSLEFSDDLIFSEELTKKIIIERLKVLNTIDSVS